MSQAASQRRLSPWQLSLRQLLALSLAVSMVIGTSVRISQRYTIEFDCLNAPADDSALEMWARHQTGVVSASVVRRDRIALHVVQEGTLGRLQSINHPPLEELGYERVDSTQWTVKSSSLLTQLLAAAFGLIRRVWWMVVPMLFIGWYWTRTRRPRTSSPLDSIPT